MSLQHRHSISIPSTEIEITLENLIAVSLRKQFHPLTFSKLFKEFKHKVLANSSSTEIDLFSLYKNCSNSSLQLKYVFEILIKSDLNDNFEELTKLFTTYLARLSKNDQVVILIYFNQVHLEFPWQRLIENEPFLKGVSQYLQNAISSNINLDDDSKYIFMIAKFITNLLSGSTKSDDPLNDSILEFLEFLKVKGFDSSFEFLNTFYSNYSFSTVKKDYQLSTSLQRDLLNSRNNTKVLRLKKIIWLSQQITINFVPVNEAFIKGFKGLLNLSSVATSATNSSITYELVSSLFECLVISTDKTQSIWEHFILNKLPIVLKSLKMNQLKLSNSLINTFETVEFARNKVLISQLLKSLIGNDLVKASHFSKLFPIQTQIVPTPPLLTLEDLTHLYNNKFHETNPEFISIQESEIEDFISKVAASIASKDIFATLTVASISRFIIENDSLRLRRLLISLTINKHVFDHVLLQDSPYTFIEPLVAYFSKNVEKRPESNDKQADNQDLMMDLDLGASDSTNIQDFFADFGTILLFLQFTTKRLNLDICKLTKDSRVSNLLTSSISADYRKQSEHAKENLDSQMNDWIYSMFDNTNTDGISDDLIKSSSILEYQYMLPEVLKQAIIASQLNILDPESFVNGLEYFQQAFLISNIPRIVKYLLDFLWSSPKSFLTVIRVFTKICVCDMGGEAAYMHSLALNNVTDELRSTLMESPDSAPNLGFLAGLTKPVNVPSGSLEVFIQYILDPVGKQGTKFELISVYETADSYASGLDWLYSKLEILLSEFPSKQAESTESLLYELISNLMINYSQHKVTSNLKHWIARLSSLSDESMNLIFARSPVKKVTVTISDDDEDDGDSKVSSVSVNKFGGDLAFDSNFFGFIQDPDQKENNDSDAIMTDINGSELSKTKDESVEATSDLYISNLLLLIKSSDDQMIGNLVTKILTNLSSF